ncbi:urea ABC transporter permease subunit UrtC [Vreelandella aquamarina]|uniref:urea ABC transporter permease subunit UrtC n=1 Tax=Vreelandella aquamarina TaxID=77097 RepID=UPI00384F7ABC
MSTKLNFLGGKSGLISLLILAALILVIFPLIMGAYQLSLTGRFLSFGLVAIGLVLCWGYGGILSLGQGIFFGLGGYCIAMFLKLEASTPEATAIQTTPGIPDFMDWNRITELPWFWVPFNSFTFTLIAIIVLPAAFAYMIGIAMFKRRVSGVYFAIITQALVVILTILLVAQQGYTGGANGITDLRTLKGWNINSDDARMMLYFITASLVLAVIVLAKWLLNSKFGRILIAIRDREDRVRFSGYDVASFKAFAFCIAAVFSAIGGAMFTLQEGFMSPSLIGIIPSIEFVIFAAVGGRLSLIGAVYGALVIGFARVLFAEAYPELWLFLMGTVFIVVVLFLPYGLAGLYEKYAIKIRAMLPGKVLGTASSTESSEVSS